VAATTFAYEAIDATGLVRKGQLEGETADKVAQSLAGQRLVPVSIAPTGQGLSRSIKLPGRRGRVGARDLAVFSRQFASMSSSGLSLLRALAILEDQAEKPVLKEALHEVRTEVQGGMTLSVSMARHPDVFPSLMIDMIRAGETGGFLDKALTRLASMYESDAELRATIKAALTYPVIVLA